MHREFQPFVAGPVARWFAVGIGLVGVFAIGVGAWVVLAPVGIEHRIEAGEFVVRTRLGIWSEWLRADLNGLKNPRVVKLHRGWRELGTGRPGYCVGRFGYREFGSVQQATTCAKIGVLLERSPGRLPVVLTPEDPEGFVRAITHRREGIYPPALGPDGGPLWRFGQAAMFVGLLLVPFLLLMGRKLRYVVERGQLRIRGPLGWTSFDLSGRRAYKHTPKRLWRVLGAGMPGYWVGRFRGDEKALRVYATRRREGVLLEGKPNVWITPQDRDGFLEAVGRQGAVVKD